MFLGRFSDNLGDQKVWYGMVIRQMDSKIGKDVSTQLKIKNIVTKILLQVFIANISYYYAFLTCEISSCLFLKICLGIADKGTSSSHHCLCTLYPYGVLNFLSDQIFGCIP